MVQKFPAPEVVGKMPTSMLTSFGQEFPNFARELSWSDTNTGYCPPGALDRLKPIAEQIIDIAVTQGHRRRRAMRFTVDTHGMLPSRAQRIGAQRWHQDGILEGRIKLVVADSTPTEFLVGTIEDEQLHDSGLHGMERQELYKLIKAYDDEQLGLLGLRRIVGCPGEVNMFNGNHVHRSPRNDTDKIINRTWLRAAFSRRNSA